MTPQMKIKAANMSKSVLIAFSICFMPLTIIFPLTEALRDNNYVASFLAPWGAFLFVSNPLLDPLIYCIRLKTVRNYIFSHFGRCNIRPQRRIDEVQANSSV